MIHFLSYIEYVQVPVNIKVEDAKPSLTPEEVKLKAQELRLVSKSASFWITANIPYYFSLIIIDFLSGMTDSAKSL